MMSAGDLHTRVERAPDWRAAMTWRANPSRQRMPREVGPATVPADTVEYGSEALEAPPVTLALLERGQERYRIYCTPCHSELGDGHGMIVAARLSGAAVVSYRSAARSAATVFLRCDHTTGMG